MQDNARKCKIVQDSARECNIVQCQASLITADGAYLCPVGSIRPFLTKFSEARLLEVKEAHWAKKLAANIFTKMLLNIRIEKWNNIYNEK